jgi:teichuronic acid biosynthesis glycosyltransferase TuaG
MDHISVIMPFKDGHDYIHQALTSIQQQIGCDIEVIIVDDYSDSPLHLDPNLYDMTINVIRNPVTWGAGPSRGRGIAAATGRFVAFLDCDDLWAQDKLSIQVAHMKNFNWAFCFGGYSYVSPDGVGSKMPYIPKGPFNWNGFLSKNFTIGCLTVIYDRMYLDDPVPSHLIRRNDYHLWAQLLRQADEKSLAWGALEKSIGFHRVRKGSLSSSKVKAIWGYWIFLSIVEYNIFRRIWFFISYLWHTIFLRLGHG